MNINGDVFHHILSTDLVLAVQFGDDSAARIAIRSNNDLYKYIHEPQCLWWIVQNARDSIRFDPQWSLEDVNTIPLPSVEILLSHFPLQVQALQLAQLACRAGRTAIVELFLERHGKWGVSCLRDDALRSDNVEVIKLFDRSEFSVTDFIMFDAVNCIRYYHEELHTTTDVRYAWSMGLLTRSWKVVDYYSSIKIFPTRTFLNQFMHMCKQIDIRDSKLWSLLHTISTDSDDWQVRWTAKYWIWHFENKFENRQ